MALQLPNLPEFVISHLALCLLGAVTQTVHMPYQGAELRFLLQHSQATAFIGLSAFKDVSPVTTVLGLTAEIESLNQVISVGSEVAGTHALAELQTHAPLTTGPTLNGLDPFVLLYTSGTTANPKGVPVRYCQFLSNTRASATDLGVNASDVILSVAPFTHLYGLYTLHLALCSGTAMSLLPLFSPPELIAAITRDRASCVFAAPAHLAACRDAGLLDERDNLSSLRLVCLAGSAVPPALARWVDERLDHGVVIQLRGMSEIQAGAYTRPDDPPEVRHASAGRPSPGTHLRIVLDDGSDAAPEGEGELWVQGSSIFDGYLNNEEATREAFHGDAPNRWFRTGDLATLSASGHVTLTGRVKEIINRGGIKFNPTDVEAIIDEMPAVVRSALVPYPDPVLGERTCAVVVSVPGASLSLEDITQTLSASGIAKFKWPERLWIVDEMPLTPTQKIIRGELKRQFDQSA
ncbi:class I adenylate-forming enzyme family protein [Candidatus Entotheonella palauensis]|uniref:class I adenylate-forming enzyme family protein n=1 Tax=Candidatus Entotheonella palauensis TaxID=93172 RepID=UPI000B7E3C78|nr:class I adenylate-forming enzyme family protein [Candidatus Entotheonella palauensis]